VVEDIAAVALRFPDDFGETPTGLPVVATSNRSIVVGFAEILVANLAPIAVPVVAEHWEYWHRLGWKVGWQKNIWSRFYMIDAIRS
jgi:hypothetical protein